MFKDKGKFCLTEYSNYDLTVVAGALDVTTASEDQHYEVAANPYRLDHVCPLASDLGNANDLAVILLKRPVTSLSPVPVLPFDKIDSILSKGKLVTIEGYGHHDSAMMQFGRLFTAETPYQENNKTELIAGAASAPDTCFGDSGGPVYLTVEGTRYVVGMTSRQSGTTVEECSTESMGTIYTILGTKEHNIWLNTKSNGAYTGSSFVSGVDGGVDGGSSGIIPGCNCTVGSAPAPSRPGLWLGVGLALLVARRRRS
jgi:MYXO-CTERM domain-containing protein